MKLSRPCEWSWSRDDGSILWNGSTWGNQKAKKKRENVIFKWPHLTRGPKKNVNKKTQNNNNNNNNNDRNNRTERKHGGFHSSCSPPGSIGLIEPTGRLHNGRYAHGRWTSSSIPATDSPPDLMSKRPTSPPTFHLNSVVFFFKSRLQRTYFFTGFRWVFVFADSW